MAAWIGLSAAVLFLFANIRTTDLGVGYHYLALSAAASSVAVLMRGGVLRSVVVRRSAFFLVAFLGYFLLRLILDVPDASDLKAFTIGTSGGVIFSVAFGTMVSLVVATLYEFRRSSFLFAAASSGFLLLCMYLAVDAFSSHLSSVRDDLFLIDTIDRKYQRPGNFMILVSLIVSLQLSQTLLASASKAAFWPVFRLASVTAYLAFTAVLLATSQLIGSNSGFVVVLAICFVTMIWLFRPRLAAYVSAGVVLAKKVRCLTSFRASIPRFIATGVAGILLFFVAASVLFALSDLEPRQLRIFGFQADTLGGNSISSRLRILSSNFLTQFGYSPLFGNLRADELTTGAGTYAHSLVSIFSHLGVVGATLFGMYLYAIGKELMSTGRSRSSFFENLDIALLRILAACVVLGFAVVATFFTWMPLWFCLGALFPPLGVRRASTVSGYLREFGSRIAAH